jgi:hypothetical protein
MIVWAPSDVVDGTVKVKVNEPSAWDWVVPRSTGVLCSWKSIVVFGGQPPPVSVT